MMKFHQRVIKSIKIITRDADLFKKGEMELDYSMADGCSEMFNYNRSK